MMVVIKKKKLFLHIASRRPRKHLQISSARKRNFCKIDSLLCFNLLLSILSALSLYAIAVCNLLLVFFLALIMTQISDNSL